jgi:hypothetical protein
MSTSTSNEYLTENWYSSTNEYEYPIPVINNGLAVLTLNRDLEHISTWDAQWRVTFTATKTV